MSAGCPVYDPFDDLRRRPRTADSAGGPSGAGRAHRRGGYSTDRLAKAPDRPHAYSFDLMTRWIERYRREAEGRFLRLEAVLDRMEEQPVRGTSTKKAAS